MHLVSCPLQVETEGLRRSIQNLGVLLTTAAVAHTSVATGEGLRHAVTGQHHTITVTTKDKVLSLKFVVLCLLYELSKSWINLQQPYSLLWL